MPEVAVPPCPVGVNYLPSRQGCRFWREWDEEGVGQDLARMAAEGFTLVRIFVFWADFEPAPGRYDADCLRRLERFAAMAKRSGLRCLVSLLTIWMNGQMFDLPWRRGRSLFHDRDMRARAADFLSLTASRLSRNGDVFAYDLGDELPQLEGDAARVLSDAQVRGWYRQMAEAVRTGDPRARVLQANEASTVLSGRGFAPGNAGPLDMIAVHGFPVWSPFVIESIDSFKGSLFHPFLVSVARAQGKPVVADEIGCYGGSAATAARYMRATTASLWLAGASGLCAWSWQDVEASGKPYDHRPDERFTGLLDVDGQPKPALAPYRALAARLRSDLAGFRPVAPRVGILLPRIPCDAPGGYLATPRGGTASLFYAWLLAKRAHLAVGFVTHPDPSLPLLIVPGATACPAELQEDLTRYVTSGGVLLYSVSNHMHGIAPEALTGVRLRDYRLAAGAPSGFTVQGATFPADWEAVVGPAGKLPVFEATHADVLGRLDDGSPVFTRASVGAGHVFHLAVPFEAQLDEPHRLAATTCEALYRDIAARAGAGAAVRANSPDVEIVEMTDGTDTLIGAVNHGPEAVPLVLTRSSEVSGRTRPLVLAGKEVWFGSPGWEEAGNATTPGTRA